MVFMLEARFISINNKLVDLNGMQAKPLPRRKKNEK